ncbi:hypothetical protein D3C71_1558970 [compost metagenome]
MNSLLLIVIFILVGFSTVVMVDLHSKIQYTSYRDHMRVIWWAAIALIVVLLLIAGVLVARHVQFVNMGW